MARPLSPTNSVFGARLRDARLREGLRQADLGKKLGLEGAAATRVSRYESGVHDPDPASALAIAKALKLPVAYFYAEDDAIAEAILVLWRLPASRRRAVLTELRRFAATPTA